MIPLGQDPSIGVLPGAPWCGFSSESRRHIPISITHLERDLHALVEQLFVISFQNYQSWPSPTFFILEEKSLHFTIS